MLKHICRRYAPWLALTLLLSAGLAMADTLDVAVARVAIVYNADSSDARLLLQIALPEALDSATIRFAELRVPITSVIPDSSALTIYCRPLLIGREPGNIVWGDLGDSPDTSVVSRKGTHFGTAVIGPQTAYFDITRILTRWREGRMADRGLLLYANPRQLARFTCGRHGDEPFATVHIDYEQSAN
jgi:hypothetical protein